MKIRFSHSSLMLTPKLVMRKVQRKNGEYYEKVTGLFKRL